MTKILVLSDSHGDRGALRRSMDAVPEASALIFLGDGIGDLEAVRAEMDRKLPAYIARGNCDFRYDYPAEGLAAFEGTLIFYTHGHLYGVKGGPYQLSETAAARGADIALYGHTHIASTFAEPGFVPCCNPGSCGSPKGMDGPTYAVLTLEKGKKPDFHWYKVPEEKQE